MNRINFRSNLSKILKQSREDANYSQIMMAKKLGVTSRTIQNWECGGSCPTIENVYEWFEVLEIQPQPYIIKILYSEEFMKDVSTFTEQDVDKGLIALLPNMSEQLKRQMLYLFYGSHGSSPDSVMNMITAHLHVPLRHRINIAEEIITNYEIAESMNELIQPKHVKPNMDNLKKATQNARNAILNHKKSYNTI